MTRINTNVTSMIAQRTLKQNNHSLTNSLERLSTGLAINRGKDNPAGLIASESLRSEKAAITAAIGNAERADQVINIAEGGLQEVNSLLLEVQSLVTQTANDAGLSPEEKKANQLQIDSILQTIDRISSTTSFQGTKLLNGTFDFQVSGQASSVEHFTINAAKMEHEINRDVEVVVTASAQHAGLFLSTNGALDLTDADSRFVFEIAGSKGSREFSFASGTTLTSIAEAINTFKEVTGVSATTNGTGLMLKSEGFGSKEFVSFDIIDQGGQAGTVHQLEAEDNNTIATGGSTAFTSVTNAVRDTGQDVGAIINGIVATSDGKTARVATDFLDVELSLTTAGAQSASAISAFTITGGGAKFNLGPNVDIINETTVGIGNVASRFLGRSENAAGTGFVNLADLGSGRSSNVQNGNLEIAQKIVNNAISEVASLRGRLGAFQKNTIGATIRSLGVALENTSAAESSIRDTDFASETANLTRNQILVNAATNTLSISNSQPQNVLSLLG